MDRASDETLKELLDKYSDVKPEEIQVKLTERVQDLSRELIIKQAEAAKLKDELTTLNKRIAELSYSLLPDLFNQLNMSSYSTSYGIELEMIPEYKASLPKDEDKRKLALTWLREHAPEIVKQEFIFSYDAVEYEVAKQTLEFLHSMGLEPMVKENVHHSTLTSWVKNHFLAGEKIPFQTINAKIGTKVIIHRSKDEDDKLFARIRAINEEETDSNE